MPLEFPRVTTHSRQVSVARVIGLLPFTICLAPVGRCITPSEATRLVYLSSAPSPKRVTTFCAGFSEIPRSVAQHLRLVRNNESNAAPTKRCNDPAPLSRRLLPVPPCHRAAAVPALRVAELAVVRPLSGWMLP